ncbi:MAG: hypothetical protein LAT82_04505 [Nanoarchaeota archaeon]|nr:hypothetical protein [Nanoarchaeota archaeon]
MKIVKKGNKGENYSLQTKQLEPKQIALFKNDIVQKILNLIKHKEKYPKQIAKELKIHEQNIYYYIKKLEKNKIIKLERCEDINGTQAQYYKLSSPSFFIQFDEFEKGRIDKEKVSPYFDNFIIDGKLNSILVVGSPEPHGPNNAMAKDGYFGMSFCLFLGSYLSSLDNLQVKLDTQLTEQDLKDNNIISIGGFIVNSVTEKLNKKSPIIMTKEKTVISNISKKEYNHTNIGVVCKFKNPYNTKKEVLIISGIGIKGTQTGVLSFLHHFEQLERGNTTNNKFKCNVFQGKDYYSTGDISKIDVLE